MDAHPLRRMCCVLGALGLLLALVTPTPAAAAGELDPPFSGDGKLIADFGTTQDGANDLAIQPDGRLVVATGSGLVRYTAAGSLDPSFSGDGRVPVPTFFPRLAVQPDGRIIVTTDTGVARYRADGTPDPSFSGDGRVEAPSPYGHEDVAVQPDGKILFTGVGRVIEHHGPEDLVTRLHSDGSLDTSWAGDGTANFTLVGGISDMAIQADGKVVLAESLGSFGAYYFSLERLTADGSLDRTFGDKGTVDIDFFGNESAYPAGVEVQPDGKIVAAGADGPLYGPSRFIVSRFNPNGSPDRSFSRDGERSVPFGGNTEAGGMALQPGGGIVLAGTTSPLDRCTQDFALARLRRDGSLSGKAVTSLGRNDNATAVAVHPDGRVIAAGATGPPDDDCFSRTSDNLALARYRNLGIDRPSARLAVRRRQRLGRVVRRGLVFRLRTQGLVRGSVRLLVGRRTLRRSSPRIYRSGSTRVRVRLGRRAKRRLLQRRGGRLLLRVRLVNAEGTSRLLRARVRVR